jgi:hypothetical protein
MIEPLLGLSERDLQDVALARRSGRLAAPFSLVALQRLLSREAARSRPRSRWSCCGPTGASGPDWKRSWNW